MVNTEDIPTVFIRLPLNPLLLWIVRFFREIHEFVPIRGEILKAEEDNLVLMLRICRSGKPGHNELRFQDIPMNPKESLRDV